MSERAESRVVLRVGENPTDDPFPGEALREIAENVVVETERDFAAALDRIESGDVDCAIVEHGPGFDGLSLLESVRRTRPSFPVILLPETVDGDVSRRAVRADVTAFVPQTVENLSDAVREELVDVVPTRRGDQVRMPIHDRTATEEQRLKERALDEAPVGITIGDATRPDEPLIYVNDSFEDVTGYDKEEAIGVNCRFLQGEDTDAETVAEVREAVENEESVAVELLNYRPDGSTFWNNLAISPIRDDKGEVTNYVAFQQDITERKEAEAAIREERKRLQRVLDRVEGLVSDLTEILVRADDRPEIHRLTAERFDSGTEFDRAWIGEYDPTAHALTVVAYSDRDGEPTTIDLDDDRPATSALDRAIETTEIQPLSAGLALDQSTDGDECDGAGIAIPLTYRRTTYGVLAVFDADAEAFDETERTILGALGRVVGSAINDVLSKRTVTADVTITVEAELSDPSLFLIDLAGRTAGAIEYRGIHVGDNGAVRFLLAVDAADEETLLAAPDRYDGVTDVSVLSSTDGERVLALVARGAPFVDALTTYGAEIESMSVEPTGIRVRFQVATEQNGRSIVEELESIYDGVELLAYHETESEATSPQAFKAAVESELTDRQLTALRTAYASGFFEWPRESDGDDLAEAMDVVPSTYYQHLRTAEKKLVRAFFES
ncbi:bacterio-opsin activator domain-containing protein [Halorhabdus amylolytica]|uniref:bacterio-opsin activator domain-containing protein n=1 Tax=Halorhabdus amylolytica TaxID=2559573 RepID=UPI0010AA336E|nr:bacterio-opsin activator domain-containing protein [Halorhabdus amylolytica]